MFPPSFNPAARPPSRSGAAKNYFLPVPSGFSVQVFKAPAMSARPYAAKVDLDYRPMARADSQSRQQSGHVSRQQEPTRKLLKAPPAEEPSFAKRSYEHKPSSGRYAIHPGPVPDTYIYERSMSSKSEYPYSPSDVTSECDSIFSVNTQISSGSSSSSVTDSPPNTRMLQIRAASPSSEHCRSRSPPSYHHRSMTTFPQGHACPQCNEASPPSRASSNKGDYIPYPSRPLPTPPVGARVRKDSILLASERSMPSDTRQHSTLLKHGERVPFPAPPVDEQGRGSTGTQLSRSTSLKGNLSIAIPPPPGLDLVPGGHYEYPPLQGPVLDNEPIYRPPGVPHRRNFDGNQTQPPRSLCPIPLARSVRWCDDLICPSPIFPGQRRKGFFNRRGDQLWRNDGAYRLPPPGEAYPPDLDGYPEPGEGWQNEEGTRIDIGHRLIPKPPLRSVLKPTNYKSQDGIIAGYLTAVPSSPTSDDE
ncbi:uncharacterized protein EDB91DRAFT_713982 [Suillus paluster]|uniref:uncharacterized protein n=1 Tax=Suillus paluster TaxID=48578 RepID=UPI001B8649D7|nr:uncharacterized protein EDB91DRAFT_713982 [Suillus paluster]KAG1731627.1 hypothetical protein EDB91DRAFT_713982 [Suillus paluster]